MTSFKLENSEDKSTATGTVFNFSSDGKYCAFNDRNENLYLVSLNNISKNNLPLKPILFATEENDFGSKAHSFLHYNGSNTLAIGNTLSGYVYSWKLDSFPDLKKHVVYYDNNNRIEMRWSNIERFAYTFSNNRIHFGNVSKELKQIKVKIESEVIDIFTNQDSSQLVVLSKNELFTVKMKYYLWDLIPLRTYSYPLIKRQHQF